MPQVTAIEVSARLIERTPELSIQLNGRDIQCSTGLQCGSRCPCGPANDPVEIFDYLPESLLERTSGIDNFARVLVLDKWLANVDGRQAIFTRMPRERDFQVLLIDQGHCLNAGEWTFPDQPLRGVYGRNYVYRDVTGWESFEPALSKAEQASFEDIWRCAEGIPPEWYEHDSENLRRVIETVYARRSRIRQLITAFRVSVRNPFPNWRQA